MKGVVFRKLALKTEKNPSVNKDQLRSVSLEGNEMGEEVRNEQFEKFTKIFLE